MVFLFQKLLFVQDFLLHFLKPIWYITISHFPLLIVNNVSTISVVLLETIVYAVLPAGNPLTLFDNRRRTNTNSCALPNEDQQS